MSERMSEEQVNPSAVDTLRVIGRKLWKSVCVIGGAVRKWWQLTDTYQQRARGWAVSGFVFSLLNLFTFGCLPPLSYLAIVFCVVALCRGNRALISLLGIAAGRAGVMLSGRVYGVIHEIATDGVALQEMLEGFMTGIQTLISDVLNG